MRTNFSIDSILRGPLQTFSSDPPSSSGGNASLRQHLTIINNAARQSEPTQPLRQPANAYSLQANDSLRRKHPQTLGLGWVWLARIGENERFEITFRRWPPPAVHIPIKRNDAATLRAIIVVYGQEETHKGKPKQILNLVMDDIIAFQILNQGSLPQSAPHPPPDHISTKTSNTGIGLQQDSILTCRFGVDTITMPDNTTYKIPNECQLAYLMAAYGLQGQGYKYLAFIQNKFVLNLGAGQLQGENKEIFRAWVNKINELIASKKIFLLWPHKTYKVIASNIRKIAPFLQHENTAVDLGWLLRATAEQRNETVVTCPELAKKDAITSYRFAIRHLRRGEFTGMDAYPGPAERSTRHIVDLTECKRIAASMGAEIFWQPAFRRC